MTHGALRIVRPLNTLLHLWALSTLWLVACESNKPVEEAPPTTDERPVADEPSRTEATPDLTVVASSESDISPPSDSTRSTSAPKPIEPVPPLARDCSINPPTPAQRNIIWGITEDAPAEVLLGEREELYGTHYYVSDEDRPDLFAEHLKKLDGAYVGIGSDQGYVFIGWMRPRVAWLLDYDPHIVAIHHIHQTFFKEAETPEAFAKLWRQSSKKHANELFRKHLTGVVDPDLLAEVLNKGHYRVPHRLRALRQQHNALGVKSFVNDLETYTYVRQMIRNGCVRPVLGNLLERDALQGVAEAARRLHVDVGALYVSNAESYWAYNDIYRQNIGQLPFNETSIVMRTLASAVNDDYRYNIQPALNFVGWLKEPWVVNVFDVVSKAHVRDANHFPFTITTMTAEAGRAKHEAAKNR